uniref:ZBR-type domain-containing protein n=1 Tax=Salarias fasciatus TaxID=181472 RepID=A0A672H4P9_SALFA
MQSTPDLNVYQSCGKDQRGYDSPDSGYSGVFQKLGNTTHSQKAVSPIDLDETPKENLRVTQNKGGKEALRFLTKDCLQAQSPPEANWCQTPKVHKRDASVRKRLLMCKSNTGVENTSARSPCEHQLSASFESLDITNASNCWSADQDRSLSGRKRRLRFTQMRTSTLNDAVLYSGSASSFERDLFTDSDFSLGVCSPRQSNVGTLDFSEFLYLREDSGFGSLDKSQESSEDHDGSFQELLRSGPKANCKTPNVAETKRRPRLQRQHRLSTLKEGGSQSEEDAADKKHIQKQNPLSVFWPTTKLENRTPQSTEPSTCSAGLLETQVTLRTTMPLAGLIGRKMGLGQVDILTELTKRNLRHILTLILGLLDSNSVCSFSKVCRNWDEIVQQDKQARLRKRNYLNEVETALENSQSTFLFQVAKTLFSDECLKPCPKCESPARCHSTKREGVCSRADCAFQFCTSCLCSFHGSRECASQSAGRRTKSTLIPGSAESKRNIRRL